MKPIKQKGQEYVGLDLKLEAVLDALLYSPRHRKGFQRNYKNGVYKKRFYRLRGLTLKKFGPIHDLKLHACGVSHLDAAWLYPVVDTKERAYKTFYKAMEHCDEFPFLTFAQTTPQYYDWIKSYDPKMWVKLKQYIANGRIEVTGGMWVEPDLDMPCGESLVRQRLYGQLFNLREFGKMPTMESLLDVFGFPHSLPQILLKSGATTFWTTKCSGSVPPAFFYWQGLDGSRIFTFQFTYNWDALMSQQAFRRKTRYPVKGCEGEIISSKLSNQEIESKFSKTPNDFNRNLPLFYGLGDGGRGPLELEIMFADTLMQMHGGKHTSQHQYMAEMQKLVGDRYLVWDDEMFLHMHHGTKTTQIEVKHYHRRAELWANAAETLLTILNLSYSDKIEAFMYNKKQIFEIWRLILFNQFHDILPGSSIPDVYILAVKELKDSILFSQKIIDNALSQFKIQSNEKIIFNSFNWTRAEYVRIEDKWYYLKRVNPLSIITINLKETLVSANDLNCAKQQNENFILENNILKATIKKSTGTLISLIYKSLNREMLETKGTYKESGSGLRVFYDDPQSKWKAWDIDKQYALHKIPITIKKYTENVIDSTGQSVIQTEYLFLNSTTTVTFSLFPQDRYLRMHIHTDMKDPKLLVKYFIPLKIKSDYVTSDIPYGIITRPRIKKSEIEKLKWETSMQKWLDVSDKECGMQIINNNRYGFSSTRKGIYLTLTRTATYPGVSPLYGSTRIIPPKERPIYTDMQAFDYEFALLPHKNSWGEEHLWQEAYNFNLPIICCQNNPNSPQGAIIIDQITTGNFISLDSPNIQIGAIKPSEWCGDNFKLNPQNGDWSWDRKSIVIRLVETEGIPSSCKLKFSSKLIIDKVCEVNLLEIDSRPLDFDLNSSILSLEFTKFEIKTIRVIFK